MQLVLAGGMLRGNGDWRRLRGDWLVVLGFC